MATSYEFIKLKIEELKGQHPELRPLPDYKVFTVLCMKYFCYDVDENFDIETCVESVVDGPNDGGIDAVLVDPQGNSNDMFVIQSKYYDSASMNKDDIIAAISKIGRTIRDIDNHKNRDYSKSVISKIINAKQGMSSGDVQKIMFYTTYDPVNKKSRSKLENDIEKEFPDLDIDMKFGHDICKQIETSDNVQTSVPYGKLRIDSRDNVLKFDGEKAVIVNVSAQSLSDLYYLHQNNLFTLNLRYYIRNRNVDKGIDETIANDPSEFWYRNNGITIICDDYEFDGTEIKLSNFSIINGGQTTYKVGRANIEHDFYLLCKVVKCQGSSVDEKDSFVMRISQATNAQKPIKQSDLMANSPEQLKLKKELAAERVYYIIKRGDSCSKKSFSPYAITTIQKFGKISMASVLQQPAKARNNNTAIFKEDVYNHIFMNPNVKLVADMLRVDYYYSDYRNKARKETELDSFHKSIINNGATFQSAAILLYALIYTGRIKLDQLCEKMDDGDAMARHVTKACRGNWRLFNNSMNEKEECAKFSELFYHISLIFLERFEAYADSENGQRTTDVSNYFKREMTYQSSILPWLVRRYKRETAIKEILSVLCGSDVKM